MLVLKESFAKDSRHLMHFLKVELPLVANKKTLVNACIQSAVTSGHTRPVDDNVFSAARILANCSLIFNSPPSVDTAYCDICRRSTGKCDINSAMYDPVEKKIYFDAELVGGLDWLDDRATTNKVLEVVALHEIAHWIHDVLLGKDEGAEVGIEFEKRAYSETQRKDMSLLMKKVRNRQK